MTTAKIAALQQIQRIQRFFKSPTVKDGSIKSIEIVKVLCALVIGVLICLLR